MENDDMPLLQTGDLVVRYYLSNGIPAIQELELVVDVDNLHFAVYNGYRRMWASHPMRYDYRLVQRISCGGKDV